MQNEKLPELALFKIDASRCNLQVGDRVTPDTIVGEDFESTDIVTAGCHGQVRNIGFVAEDHALVVVIEKSAYF